MKRQMNNVKKNELVNTEELERSLRAALERRQATALKAALDGQHPANIGDVLERLNVAQRRRVFNALELPRQADVLAELAPNLVRDVAAPLKVGQIAAIVDAMPMDEAAYIIPMFPRRRSAILEALEPKHALDIQRLLQYPVHSAGRMMTEKFVRVHKEWRAADTLVRLRRMNADVETLNNLYVVDDEERLEGVVSLREVVVAPARKKLGDLMNTQLVSVTPQTDREDVARLLSHYDYLAMPVLDPGGRMLGIIPVDDVIDVLAAESTEDILRFGGVESGPVDQPYFTIPLKTAISRRIGWLLLLFVAETLTGMVLRHFESELAAVVALSFFIPLLIGTGGNTGAQTVSTLIRGLALGEVTVRDSWKVIGRELLSGLLIGLLLGSVSYMRAKVWGSSDALALTVSLSVLVICTWANTIGSLIPLLAQRFKIDPAAVSAPLITTLVDATGLAIYLYIAKAVMGL
jgi:magnesium transporter